MFKARTYIIVLLLAVSFGGRSVAADEVGCRAVDSGAAVTSAGGIMLVGQTGIGTAGATGYRAAFGFITCVAEVPAPVAGDCDHNGILGLGDLVDFTDCMAGPIAAPEPGCYCADFNSDGQIDLLDFAHMQELLTGT